jgi:hypothetical protein
MHRDWTGATASELLIKLVYALAKIKTDDGVEGLRIASQNADELISRAAQRELNYLRQGDTA